MATPQLKGATPIEVNGYALGKRRAVATLQGLFFTLDGLFPLPVGEG